MRRRDKITKLEESSPSEDDMGKRRNSTEAVTSDDDEEANRDLSLDIVRKSKLRVVNNDPRGDGVAEIVMDMRDEKKKREKKRRKKKAEDVEGLVDSASDLNGMVMNLKEGKRKTEKKRKTKREEVKAPVDSVGTGIDTGFKDFCGELFLADNRKVDDKPESTKAEEVSINAVDTNPVDPSENAVLRKLLRGPRYFDPPDNSWGACYNCGEEGHMTVNCTAAKRKKPCFVCGSFEHNAKQCTKGRDCFICKQQGHRAKDCSERNKSSKICLKCGDLGHDMFSCRNDYHPDDLKEIQCYACGSFGHLCCKSYSDDGPQTLSCYRCGLSGHTGLACNWLPGDSNDMASSANSCYRCGLQGHFARECTSSIKAGKRHREPSTPKQKSSKKYKDEREAKSAPHAFDKKRTKKHKYQEFTSSAKTKSRGGWITEDPEYYYPSNSKSNNWRSPAAQNNRRVKISNSKGDYASGSRSRKSCKLNYDDSPPTTSTRFYQSRYSASRFGNTHNNNIINRMGRSNDWW